MAVGAKYQMKKVMEAACFIKERFHEFSALIDSIKFVESDSCRFAAASKGVIKFNPVTLIPLSQPDVRAILIHEIGHHYFDAPIIPCSSDKETSRKLQIIHDVYINDNLRNYYEIIKSDMVSELFLFPERFGLPKSKSFEYYHSKLFDNI